jgi:hypothetical protein
MKKPNVNHGLKKSQILDEGAKIRQKELKYDKFLF